jgi:hypothetical protein
MRYFLVLMTLPLFASAQVTLPEAAARFYLQQHKRVEVLTGVVQIKDKRIENLETQVTTLKSINHNLEKQVMTERMKAELSHERVIRLEGTNRKLIKEARKQKFLKNIAIIGGVTVLVLNELIND